MNVRVSSEGCTEQSTIDINELRSVCEKMNIHVLPDGSLTTKDAAKFLGISEKTLANQRSKGGKEVLPFCKRFGRIRYNLKDIAQYRIQKFTSCAQARVDQLRASDK